MKGSSPGKVGQILRGGGFWADALCEGGREGSPGRDVTGFPSSETRRKRKFFLAQTFILLRPSTD